ncbi:28472_t:CDS:2, partial [Gigaspora margarita]
LQVSEASKALQVLEVSQVSEALQVSEVLQVSEALQVLEALQALQLFLPHTEPNLPSAKRPKTVLPYSLASKSTTECGNLGLPPTMLQMISLALITTSITTIVRKNDPSPNPQITTPRSLPDLPSCNHRLDNIPVRPLNRNDSNSNKMETKSNTTIESNDIGPR